MKKRKKLKQSMEVLAEELASSDTRPGSLASPDQKKLMYLKMIDENIERFNKECTEGFELLMQEVSSSLWGKEKEKFAQEMLFVLQKVDSDEKLDKHLPLIRIGRTWREILPLSDFFMNQLQGAAISLFNSGKYEQALSCFSALSWLDSHNYAYFLALGFCCFHVKRYEQAMAAYAEAAQYATDTALFLYLADCFDKMGNLEKAKQSVEEGLKEELEMPSPDRERIRLFEKAYEQYRSQL